MTKKNFRLERLEWKLNGEIYSKNLSKLLLLNYSGFAHNSFARLNLCHSNIHMSDTMFAKISPFIDISVFVLQQRLL